MKPRFFFRENGRVINTQPEIDWGWGCCAALILVMMMGWGYKIDNDSADHLQAIVDARSGGFAAGRMAGRQDADEETTRRLTSAYEYGLADGLYASRNKPEGLALAQACGALKQLGFGAAGAP